MERRLEVFTACAEIGASVYSEKPMAGSLEEAHKIVFWPDLDFIGYELFAEMGTKSGTGRIEIKDVTAPSQVRLQLVMSKPVACDNTVTFTLQPEGAATRVTWAMGGRTSLVGKVMGVCFDMEKMVGGSFEQGLASLKAIAEKA